MIAGCRGPHGTGQTSSQRMADADVGRRFRDESEQGRGVGARGRREGKMRKTNEIPTTCAQG